MTTSGAAENGSETLRQPLANVHRRANTVEDEAGMAEFQTAMMLPSWANVADTYWADVATTEGDPKEREAMFPARSRLICTGTSTRSPAAGPPSARIRIVRGEVNTVAGLRYGTVGGG